MKRLLCIALLLLLPACARSTARLGKLDIGMEKPEVLAVMGKPDVVRAKVPLKDGNNLEVWEYSLTSMRHAGNYVLYFYEDRLAQWGEPGDFTPEQVELFVHQPSPE